MNRRKFLTVAAAAAAYPAYRGLGMLFNGNLPSGDLLSPIFHEVNAKYGVEPSFLAGRSWFFNVGFGND